MFLLIFQLEGGNPSPMLMCGLKLAALSLPSGLFNHKPQSVRLGFTSHGAYIFAPNVAPFRA